VPRGILYAMRARCLYGEIGFVRIPDKSNEYESGTRPEENATSRFELLLPLLLLRLWFSLPVIIEHITKSIPVWLCVRLSAFYGPTEHNVFEYPTPISYRHVKVSAVPPLDTCHGIHRLSQTSIITDRFCSTLSTRSWDSTDDRPLLSLS